MIGLPTRPPESRIKPIISYGKRAHLSLSYMRILKVQLGRSSIPYGEGGREDSKAENLSNHRLSADKQGRRTDKTTMGLEPAQIGADSLDPAQQPAKAPTQLDHRVPAAHLMTIEPNT